MPHWESIHTETRDGFDIELAFAPEEDAPRDHFATGDDEADAQIVRDIESGRLMWFVARVTASRAGVVLGDNYLGGCCYRSAQEFMAPDGYYPGMVVEAVFDARATLAKLCKGATQ